MMNKKNSDSQGLTGGDLPGGDLPGGDLPGSALALWLLRHTCPGRHSGALIGDLFERVREGQTRGWFWRQVLIACAFGILSKLRRYWPHVCYAIAGFALANFTAFFDKGALNAVPRWLHWSQLPWPASQIIFEMSRPGIFALAALPVLAAGLFIDGSFRWACLLRTGGLQLVATTLFHFSIDLFPWLWQPVPGDPYHKALIMPVTLQVAGSFSAFLFAAWLGCFSRQPPEPIANQM